MVNLMARTDKRLAWLAAVLTALSGVCSAQEKPFIPPRLPAANWRQVDAHALPDSFVPKFGGEPAVEQEYGVKTLESRTYQVGKTHLQVIVELAADSTSAYGLLTFYRTAAMKPEIGMDLAVGDANQTLMARGSNFLRFLRDTDGTISDSDFHALLVFVGGTKPSENALRGVPRPLSGKGLVPGTEKYLLGLEAAKRVLPSFRTDLIGFDQGAEVQLGQYQNGSGAATLLSIDYPTPQIARVRFGSLTDFLGLNQDRGENSVYGRREDSYVFLVLNVGNSQSANLLLDQFRVTQSVSWDQKYNSERTFTLQLVYMILSILLLTAFLVGGCVIAGVLFYYSRRLAAKLFPESQWGRADDEQLIRLNLKS